MPAKKASTLVIVFSVVVGLASFIAVQYMGIYQIAALVGGGIGGAICGLLPFLLHRKKKPKFAKLSLWVSIGCGLLLGALLALPIAVILAAIGYARNSEPTATEPPEIIPPEL